MAYTDIWRCKYCDVLPDIQMIGRSFRITCENCDDRDSHIEADSLDEVVSIWNRLHEPPKPATGLVGRMQGLVQLLKDSAEYHVGCFREKRERSARLKRSVQEIRESESTEEEKNQTHLDAECVNAGESQEPRF
jgi:hypothetical protein